MQSKLLPLIGAALLFLVMAQAQPPIRPGEYVSPPWKRVSIGDGTAPGKVFPQKEGFAVVGGGMDIWEKADSFEFVYQELNGDGALIARVASMQNTDVWAKAGLMLREDLASGARNAAVIVNPDQGAWLQKRSVARNETEEVFGGDFRCPLWLAIERRGDVVRGFFSQDGKTWRGFASATLPQLKRRASIGLAVCSHAQNSFNRSVFEQIKLLDKMP